MHSSHAASRETGPQAATPVFRLQRADVRQCACRAAAMAARAPCLPSWHLPLQSSRPEHGLPQPHHHDGGMILPFAHPPCSTPPHTASGLPKRVRSGRAAGEVLARVGLPETCMFTRDMCSCAVLHLTRGSTTSCSTAPPLHFSYPQLHRPAAKPPCGCTPSPAPSPTRPSTRVNSACSPRHACPVLAPPQVGTESTTAEGKKSTRWKHWWGHFSRGCSGQLLV